MARILIADPLSPSAADVLRAAPGIEVDVKPGLSHEELVAVIGEYDGVLLRRPSSIDAEVLFAADRLQMIGRAGITTDNIDVEAATRRGVVVMNTPFGNATTVAEHAIGLMFALARDLPRAVASMARGEWAQSALAGRQLSGKTLGIIGLGTVGRLVALRGQGLDMTVIGFDPWVDEAVLQKQVDIEVVSFAELFARADFVSLHVPLTERTHHFIGEAAFVAMKPDACIINCARGGLIDEDALLRALDAGELGGAALDVFEQMPPAADHPLRRHPRVIATPHLSAQTPEALEAVSRHIAEQARDFFLHGVVDHAVNVPRLGLEQRKRLAPHLELAARVARIAGQLHGDRISEVRLVAAGDFDPDDVAPIEREALSALLSTALGEAVNPVAARAVAGDRKITVASIARDGDTDFSNLIRLDVRGPDGATQVEGAVFGRRELRIVGLDGHRLDLVPEGHILAIRNHNRPGVIGAVGSILGRHGINVARLALGLRNADDEALALWCTDTRADDAVVEALCEVDGVVDIRRIELADG